MNCIWVVGAMVNELFMSSGSYGKWVEFTDAFAQQVREDTQKRECFHSRTTKWGGGGG